MNKIMRITLAAMLLCTMTACVPSKESAAKNTVNSYFVSLEEGNLDDAYKYLDTNTADNFSSLKDAENQMTTMLDQYNVSDVTKQLFSDAFNGIVKLCIKSHKITHTEKVSDAEYKITTTASILDSDDITNAISSIDSNSFFTDISSKVMEKYTNEGETAAMEYMMTEMANWLTSSFSSALSNLQPSDQTIVATVDKKDNDWLITSLEEQK